MKHPTNYICTNFDEATVRIVRVMRILGMLIRIGRLERFTDVVRMHR